MKTSISARFSSLMPVAILLPTLLVSACEDGETDDKVTYSTKEQAYVAARVSKAIEGQAKKIPGTDPASTANANGCGYCDVLRGVDNCGKPCSGHSGGYAETACGSPGQCECSSGNYYLVGRCPSRAPLECTFCPPGTSLGDPCGDKCMVDNEYEAPSPDGTACPNDYPVTCGGGSCCPNSHSVCCADSIMCGNTYAACANSGSSSGGSGSGSGGGSGGSCADFANRCSSMGSYNASLRAGCCNDNGCVRSCVDGCGSAWYEADGRMFGPCSGQDSGCLERAAEQAVSFCYESYD